MAKRQEASTWNYGQLRNVRDTFESLIWRNIWKPLCARIIASDVVVRAYDFWSSLQTCATTMTPAAISYRVPKKPGQKNEKEIVPRVSQQKKKSFPICSYFVRKKGSWWDWSDENKMRWRYIVSTGMWSVEWIMCKMYEPQGPDLPAAEKSLMNRWKCDNQSLLFQLFPAIFLLSCGHHGQCSGQFLKPLANGLTSAFWVSLKKLWVVLEYWQVKICKGSMTLHKFSLASQELRRVTCECSQSLMFKKLAPGLMFGREKNLQLHFGLQGTLLWERHWLTLGTTS